MLKKFLIYHLIPFSISLFLIVIIVISISFSNSIEKHVVIEGQQIKTKGWYSRIEGNEAELNYISSIKNKNQITVFGSSEFSDSPYCPYNFLPDSLGLQTMGVGHAFHQSLSILCELLAVDKDVDSSKICIILSPGWFATEGTNTSAFIEFVRPNFLTQIINNKNISSIYKEHIGEYIYNHQSEIDGISNEMEILRDYYLSEQGNLISKSISKIRNHLKKSYPTKTIEYKEKLTFLETKIWNGDYHVLSKKLQNEFVSKITTNNIYVYDEYYTTYLLDDNGKERKGNISEVDITNNTELNDFKILVQYLKSKNVNCSFVIQPLNPYCNMGLENNNKLISVITQTLSENNIPYFNMYLTTTDNYEPGTLKDIMHLGDYGWMKINMFLANLYHEN